MSFGFTPLLNAIDQKDLAAVISLIKAKANLDRANNLGVTPIQKASSLGQLEIVKILISNGVHEDTHVRNNVIEDTPVFLAARNGHLHVVKYLIEERNVNPFDKRYLKKIAFLTKDILTPLKIAETNGHLHVVEYLKTLESK